ncbi:D-amino acid aminotransferase [Clostridium folliculivorans]|uniref:Cytochrome c550 n=1 Tax=Clostridium folliculivorans TaxID=2886038 RepID=A0A9W5Y4Y8_9CLOT|nr:D-amino acid aminotransferase [Clostridium folliculivorans]GKU26532.1 cytochrome c550 [Clostridium folliculivorans]GKU29036.1 cytochrome c550 [Clostridium folliculivorans]
MENLGFYNGEYDLIENMKIPMNDRVCYFGDGVYDATYSRNHKIFALDEHIDRFFNSAKLLSIKIPYTKNELKDLLQEMVKKVDSGEQFVYWQVTRGTAMRNHAFPEAEVKANVWILLTPRNIKDMSKKVKLITLEDTRFLHCNIKTLNLLPNVIAAQKTEEAGCDETIFHRADRVTECAHSNISIIKNGVFKTAPTDNLILPGIARAHIIKMCERFNIPVDETPFTVKELMEADEVIVTSSGQFCMSACEVDGKPVGGKASEIVGKLQAALLEEFLEQTN